MKLGKIRETYHAATRRVTEITQTSSLGGLGAVWLLRPQSEGALIPSDLMLPLIAFVVALALDLFQFVWRSLAFALLSAYRRWQFKLSARVDEDAVEVGKNPIFINVFSWGFFIGKVAAMIFGFVLLAQIVYQKFEYVQAPTAQETRITPQMSPQ
jgi:hypothetical protein